MQIRHFTIEDYPALVAIHNSQNIVWPEKPRTPEAGIPPADILRSATIVPAQFMSLGDRLGSISEGKMASVVLIRANPLEDIRNAQQIESVFLRGQYFSREDLDRLLDEAKELAQQATTP